MAILELKTIHAGYGKKEVLRGLSLSVEPGTILALFGGNGAGKSTALRVIAGVIRPWSGSILFKGQDICGLLPHEIRRLGISYLPQNGRVFKSLTVAENLSLAGQNQRGTRGGFVFPLMRDLSSRRAGLLSGGERQMLSIELALRKKADIFLLDEPTAALSERLVRTTLDRLTQIAKEERTGVILVEQNVEEARRISDTEVYLQLGKDMAKQ